MENFLSDHKNAFKMGVSQLFVFFYRRLWGQWRSLRFSKHFFGRVFRCFTVQMDVVTKTVVLTSDFEKKCPLKQEVKTENSVSQKVETTFLCIFNLKMNIFVDSDLGNQVVPMTKWHEIARQSAERTIEVLAMVKFKVKLWSRMWARMIALWNNLMT